MPRKGVPEGITREYLEVAFSLIDGETPHRFAGSTKYDVIYQDKRYPPKAVVGLAAELLTGDTFGPDDFTGGVGSACFRILQEHGFKIVAKFGGDSALVYRVTGPPENFITAMTIGYWALNPKHEKLWNRLQQGDILLFHSTTKSQFADPLEAAIVGYARVGSNKFEKAEQWWVQEIKTGENIWPFAFSLDQVCLIAELSERIDLSRGVHEKSDDEMHAEVTALAKCGIPLSKLNEVAKSRSVDLPNFPVNGSMSLVNDVYRELIFSEEVKEWFLCHGKNVDELVEDEFFSDQDLQGLSALSREQLLEIAKTWIAPYSSSHSKAWRRVRKEDARQKKIVAQIEKNTCQICGFFCEYLTSKGQSRFVIHVDHILEKSADGDERVGNLWVLCPNCHAKKSAGLIEVDLVRKVVLENGAEIEIRDSHLFV